MKMTIGATEEAMQTSKCLRVRMRDKHFFLYGRVISLMFVKRFSIVTNRMINTIVIFL